MGQRNSSHQAHGNMSLYRSFRKKRSETHKELSATFHVLDVNMIRNNLLNINDASEEEFMTLPGISRTIARNVVDYRRAIGSFKKIEDLALVSGIGASKLQQIRGEITTNNRFNYLRKNDSSSCQTSISEEQSLDSFFSGESGRTKPFFKVINVNTANVFQLMSIQGLTQELAANIVDYRDRKGIFKTLDQLLKVKGLNYRTLGAIRLYLTTESLNDIENDSGVLDMKTSGEIELYEQIMNNSYKNSKLTKCHRRSKSAPMKYASFKEDTAPESDLFILLSNRSKRPILTPYFDFNREKRPAVRIATWNLENLTDEKVSNPGTIEVICRTILENGIGILCCQDLLSVAGLQKIISEMSEPTLPWVKQWPGLKGSWKFAMYHNSDKTKPFNVYIYDASQEIELTKPIQKVSYLSSICLVANFKIQSLDVNFVSVIDNQLDSEDVIPLNGNCDKASLIVCGQGFEGCNLEHTCCDLPLKCSTKIAESDTKHHIYVDKNSKNLLTGQSGSITEGLSHMAIPQGWKWGGAVSHHTPTWVELFVDQPSFLEANL